MCRMAASKDFQFHIALAGGALTKTNLIAEMQTWTLPLGCQNHRIRAELGRWRLQEAGAYSANCHADEVVAYMDTRVRTKEDSFQRPIVSSRVAWRQVRAWMWGRANALYWSCRHTTLLVNESAFAVKPKSSLRNDLVRQSPGSKELLDRLNHARLCCPVIVSNQKPARLYLGKPRFQVSNHLRVMVICIYVESVDGF